MVAMVAAMVVAVCWQIWKARNAYIFKDITPDPVTTARWSKQDIDEWRIAWSSRPGTLTNHSPPSCPISTTPPSNPQRVIHCDGSFIHDPQLAAYGITVSDVHGLVYDGRVGSALVSSPITAEAKAIQVAVEYAAQHPGVPRILSDCQVLTEILKKSSKPWSWDCASTIACIHEVISSSPNIEVSFIPRKQNNRADWVVKTYLLGSLPDNWTHLVNSINVSV